MYIGYKQTSITFNDIHRFLINQSSHGFENGVPIYWDLNTSQFEIADSSDPAKLATWIVQEKVDSNNFYATETGRWSIDLTATFGQVLGTLLAADKRYFVASGGTISDDDSLLPISNPIFKVLSVLANVADIIVEIGQAGTPRILKGHYDAEITRVDADTARMSGKISKLVEVNNVPVSIASNKDIDFTSVTLIEGGSPATDTPYNLYLDTSGNFLPSATVVDSSGYRTGDKTNRFVGRVYLDSSGQIENEWNLIGIKQKYFFITTVFADGTPPLNDLIRSSGAYDAYDQNVMLNIPVFPRIIATAHCQQYASNTLSNWAAVCIAKIDSNTNSSEFTADSSVQLLGPNSQVSKIFSSFALAEAKNQYFYGGSGTLTIYHSGSQNNLQLIIDTTGY